MHFSFYSESSYLFHMFSPYCEFFANMAKPRFYLQLDPLKDVAGQDMESWYAAEKEGTYDLPTDLWRIPIASLKAVPGFNFY